MPKGKKSTKKKTAKKSTKEKGSKKLDLKKVKLPKVKGLESLKPALKIVGIVILIVASLALIDLAVQYFNNDYSVAVVNGVRIPESKWHNRLETAYGSSVASQLIEEQIIRDEAKKQDISVDEGEIDAEMEKIVESIGGEELFEEALKANNITREELREQIEVDLLVAEILAPELEYEEEDVKEFFTQYSDVIFPEETAQLEEGELLDFEEYGEETENIFIQQEVQNRRTTWLSEKKNEYKIQDNSTSKPSYGFLTITTNIVNNLLEEMGGEETE
jgi:hypothetical protein